MDRVHKVGGDPETQVDPEGVEVVRDVDRQDLEDYGETEQEGEEAQEV